MKKQREVQFDFKVDRVLLTLIVTLSTMNDRRFQVLPNKRAHTQTHAHASLLNLVIDILTDFFLLT